MFMNRVSYQNLRFEVEGILLNELANNSCADSCRITNLLMRSFLAASLESSKADARAKRQFVTFRRKSDVTVPGWAFKAPGTTPAAIEKGR
jgi:hypothetical protein